MGGAGATRFFPRGRYSKIFFWEKIFSFVARACTTITTVSEFFCPYISYIGISNNDDMPRAKNVHARETFFCTHEFLKNKNSSLSLEHFFLHSQKSRSSINSSFSIFLENGNSLRFISLHLRKKFARHKFCK